METEEHFAATAAAEIKIFCRSSSLGHLAPKEVSMECTILYYKAEFCKFLLCSPLLPDP